MQVTWLCEHRKHKKINQIKNLLKYDEEILTQESHLISLLFAFEQLYGSNLCSITSSVS